MWEAGLLTVRCPWRTAQRTWKWQRARGGHGRGEGEERKRRGASACPLVSRELESQQLLASSCFSPACSRVTAEECNLSTNLEVEQCDNLILIKIWCHDSEGHNDGLSFQSENLFGTTAEERSVCHSPYNADSLGITGEPLKMNF